MSQIEQINALIGMLDAELRRREAEVERKDQQLSHAMDLLDKVVARLPGAPPPP
jgi:uncharacterized small protein (DUF1192 family)